MTLLEERWMVAARLNIAIKRKKIKKGELAKRIGMHRTALSKILSSERDVKLDELKAISEELGVRAEWIIWGNDSRYGVREGEQWV